MTIHLIGPKLKMAASMIHRGLHTLCRNSRLFTSVSRQYCSSKSGDGEDKSHPVLKDSQTEGENARVPDTTSHQTTAGESALAGFAKVIEKASKIDVPASDTIDKDEEPEPIIYDNFPAMLRNSKLMQIGEPNGRVVLGTIFEVVGDDLYIDFGGKFHCVCPRPKVNSIAYHRGIRVKLRLNDFEMSSAFLGSEKHVTLQEADATLIGMHRSSRSHLSQPQPDLESPATVS